MVNRRDGQNPFGTRNSRVVADRIVRRLRHRHPTTNSFSNNGRTVLVEERERAVYCLKQAMANMKMLFNNEASFM